MYIAMKDIQWVRASIASSFSVELKKVWTEFDSHADTWFVGESLALVFHDS